MNKGKVLRLLLVVIAIGLLCLLGMGGKLYFEVNGTLWERAEARKQLEAYLQKRFTQKMVIEEYGLDFKSPGRGFGYSVQPQESDLWIHVQQQGRGSPDFIDDYYTAVWETEAEAKIQAFLQSIYTVEIRPGIHIESADFSQFPQWEISQPPAFTDLRPKVSEFTLGIRVTPDFDKDHPDREYETMYRVIQFLKESELVPRHLAIYFGYPDSNTGDDDKNYIYYYLSRDDIQAITSVQTMITILESNEDGDPSREVFP